MIVLAFNESVQSLFPKEMILREFYWGETFGESCCHYHIPEGFEGGGGGVVGFGNFRVVLGVYGRIKNVLGGG